MRRDAPPGSCPHGYTEGPMHPNGKPCLPEGMTDIDVAALVDVMLHSPTVARTGRVLDTHGLAVELIRAGYRPTGEPM